MPEAKQPFFTGPGEGDVVMNPGAALFQRVVASGTLLVKSGSKNTNGAYSIFEATMPQGGSMQFPHVHTNYEEGWYVLEGTLRFTIEEREYMAPAGSYLSAPRGSLHGFVNAGDGPAKYLTIFSPPQDLFWKRLTEMRRLAGDAPLDWDNVLSLYAEFGETAPPRP